jgi:uncharacterized protein
MTTESTGQIPPGVTPVSRNMEVLCHLLAFVGLVIPFGNIAGPLVLWLLKKSENAGVDAHGKEVLNFQISMTIWTILCWASFVVLIGFVLGPLAMLINIVLTIIGAIKASNGEFYRYPLTIRFIK